MFIVAFCQSFKLCHLYVLYVAVCVVWILDSVVVFRLSTYNFSVDALFLYFFWIEICTVRTIDVAVMAVWQSKMQRAMNMN